ncbi:hypothetical protein BURCENBC7_AP6716 [Burkholderia cenocepacia BC7]|nr:hypothetical protein [Burkholderia cenocepacia]ARF84747.1 uncharacterized protein BCN122_I1360 [Burkholderia cenocepacia]EPZ86711.1 hypothetical protein BURCENK562V_C1607 [Burkholderia cenocepacia K56-2Valvano]ERI25631.1 hypothetical protein BURCENBC7_AP6716 [Burkholderia cenocepacia BC7]MDN7679034.1 hypothetical protein [Burkholderia cenocepacia]
MTTVAGLTGCTPMRYDSGSCEEAVGRFLVGEAGKPRAALES